MAPVKFQLEELKKSNPRYVLELHTIQRMRQEADDIDSGLNVVLQRTQAHIMPPNWAPSAPHPAPQLRCAITDTPFSPPVPPTAPPAPAAMSRPPQSPPSQPAHRNKPFRSQATPTLPPIPTATPQAATPGITASYSQTPKSPKGKPKPKPSTRRNGSKTANGVKTPTAVHPFAPTLSSSKPAGAKVGGKRARDDDIDSPTGSTPSVPSAPWLKKVKTKLGGSQK